MPMGHWSNGPTWLALNVGVLWSLPNHEVAKPLSLQDPADGRLVFRDDAVVAREAGGLLRDHAEAGRVMVAAGDERRARRRAERGGMELQCSAGPLLAMRSSAGVGMTPPKVLGAPKPTSSVMMSSTLGAFLGGTTRGAHQALDCSGVVLDHAAEFRVGRRKLLAVDRRGGAGRTGCAVDLLGVDRNSCRQHKE